MAARWDGTALERRDVSYCPFLVVLPPRGSQESPQTSTSWPWGSSGTRIRRQPPGGRATPTPLPPNLPQRPPGHDSSGRWPWGWHISGTKMPGLDLPIFVTLVTSHTTTKTATNLILSITTTPSPQPPDNHQHSRQHHSHYSHHQRCLLHHDSPTPNTTASIIPSPHHPHVEPEEGTSSELGLWKSGAWA